MFPVSSYTYLFLSTLIQVSCGQLHWLIPVDFDTGSVCVLYTGLWRSTLMQVLCVHCGQLHWLMPVDFDVCVPCGQLHWLMTVDFDVCVPCRQLHWLMPVDFDAGSVCVPCGQLHWLIPVSRKYGDPVNMGTPRPHIYGKNRDPLVNLGTP